ncbi:MAG: hypothetical protein OJF62_002893 [Pseudolabrys sp.]|jgi:hypothetical protein|nr:hypothetical protein [Pseudolabrys sp.]
MKSMRFGKLALLGLFLCAAAALPANAATMKECAAQWQQMKAAKTTGGKTYKEFSKECMHGTAAAAPASAPATTTTAKPAAKPAPATTTAAPSPSTMSKPAATTTEKKAASPGREAMYERERACGKEWKEAKAANKVPAGMKWPQYWSECNKRMKAAGK